MITAEAHVAPGISATKLDRAHLAAIDPEHYQFIYFGSGASSLTVDMQTTPCYPNTILFLSPGRVLKVKFSCEPPTGWILKLPRSFFLENNLDGLNINNSDIFFPFGEIPRIVLSPRIGERVSTLTEMIAEVMGSEIPNKELAAASMVKSMLVYCDSKCNLRVNGNSNNHYLQIVSTFKQLISQHLHNKHHVADYAGMMHITPKYLNQVVKEVMGVTAKSVIQEQLLIQSCRDLRFSGDSIKEISIRLGFSEPEHFSNFFKKAMGHSPRAFRQA